MQVSDSEQITQITERLAMLRRRRRLAHVPFITAPVLGFALSLLGVFDRLPSLVFDALIVVGFACILIFWVSHLKCPRCNHEFHMGPRYRNDFARSCLWCGLRLNGQNVGEPFTIKTR